MTDFEKLRLVVENVMRHPGEFDWSTQGLGMLRVYLRPDVRLHVWDRSLLVPGASPLHSHPWNFTSTIIAGRLINRRYKSFQSASETFQEFNCVRIQCGENAHVEGEPTAVKLVQQADEHWVQGSTYRQTAEEIHWSLPEDGTVTICEREFKQDRDHALVFWRGKGGWVDAKPRRAEILEVLNVCNRSLETWF